MKFLPVRAPHSLPRWTKAPLLGSLAAALVVCACGLQGAGERCDPANFNQDCESGLQCLELRSLAPGEQLGAICCPPTGGPGACVNTTLHAGSDAGAEPSFTPATADAGTGPDSGGSQPDAHVGSASDAMGASSSTPDADVTNSNAGDSMNSTQSSTMSVDAAVSTGDASVDAAP